MKSLLRNRSASLICGSAVLFVLARLPVLKAQTVWGSFSQPSTAANPLRIDSGSVGLWQTLAKLHTRASLLMLVAHPDDEDGALLAYESRGQGARTILLTLNRGEGGQNVMSSAYWDALGVLRTEELLAADRCYGVQQYFARAVDFGFSKTEKESMQKWGRERVLYDAVRVVRLTRPLVITSVWVGGPSDGHGQHEVSGEITQEVFKAAADPHVFPDQIQAGLEPWQALKVYERVPTISITKKGMYDYASRRWYPVGVYDYIHHRFLPGVPEANVNVPEGQYSPILGSSYAQIGAEGLNQQKSQNGGVARPPLGSRVAGYHRYASVPAVRAHETSFFEGIDTSLLGIASLAKGSDEAFLKAGLARINRQVEEAIAHFSAGRPDETAPMLAKGLEETRRLLQQVESSPLSDQSKYNVEFELRVKENQFNTALVQALGLSIQATVVPQPHPAKTPFQLSRPATFQVAVPGQNFWVNVRLVNPSKTPATLNRVWLAGLGNNWTILPQNRTTTILADNKPASALFKVAVPQDAPDTRPYYSRPNIEQPYYNILDKRDLNLPFAPYPLSAWADVTLQGAQIRMGQVVQTVQRELGRGNVMEPLLVGPAVSVSVLPSAGIIPLDRRDTSLTVTLQSNMQGPAKGSVKLDLPAGWTSSPREAAFSIKRNGQDQAISFRIVPSDLQQQRYTISAVAQYNGRAYEDGYETIGYPGLRPYDFYRPAIYHGTGVDIKIPQGLNVGYLTGTGDQVPESLESVGIKVHFLSAQDLAANLDSYDAIVLGVRAYAARQDVKTYNGRLLDYVRNGGVLIVQYNTPEYDHNYGPYPYSLTHNPEVVVDENSSVDILNPSNPLLSWPNKITNKDFQGWVEERGHSFMKSWDPRYEALLETHDPDQPPQKGGLLYARYGKGIYIYDAYALYRQLPEGVPGAFRLIVNMVSLDRNPLRRQKLEAGNQDAARRSRNEN
jgi:LmbE family N-acetylglucosaminyl deacetylase